MKCKIGLHFVSTGKTDITPVLDDALVNDLISGLNEAYLMCSVFHTSALFPGEITVWYKVY